MSEVNANILNRQAIKVSLQGKNGGGGAIIGGAEIDENGHLIIILSDGRRIDCGKVSGDVSDAQIAEAVEKYLSENPIEVNETDPTVPEWAKAENKPKYTAEEVGAQPKGDYALKSDIPAIPEIPNDVVKYSKQELGEEQQAQARENIGAASQKEVDELSEEIDPVAKGILPYFMEREIHVGEDLFNADNITLGAGWTLANGVLTHTAGATEPVSITFDGEDQADYLLRVTTSHITGEFATFRIGDGAPELAYRARNNLVLPLKCWGTPTLVIEPYTIGTTTIAFSLSNFKLQKIQESGESVMLEYDSIITDQNAENYGYRNVFLGSRSAVNAVGATRNVTLGTDTLRDLRGGHRNIAIGGHALSQIIDSNENIGIGCDAGIYLKKGVGNIILGVGSLGYAKNAIDNVVIGRNALTGNADGTPNYNVALGTFAGYKTTSNNNVFIGYKAGYNNQAGYGNVFIGPNTNGATVPGNFNTFIGNSAYCAVDGVYYSVAIGYNARVTKPQQIMIGGDTCKEVVFCGNKKIVFGADGAVTWEGI